MTTLDEIGQEKQRISERLARLDAERTRLGDQLNELEIAERVLTRLAERPTPPGHGGEDARRELHRRPVGSAEPEASRKRPA